VQEKVDVVCEVQVLQLLREVPLDTCSPACCRLPRDSVNHHQEDRQGEQTTLMDAGFYCERFRQFPIMDHLTGGILIQLLDDSDKLWWKAIVTHSGTSASR
jgi:hypothetical protein